MKQKQRIALLGILAVALIFAACDGDSGNNSTETEGVNSSSVVRSSSSSAGASSSSVVTSSSGAKAQSSSSVTAGVVDPSTVVSGTMTDPRDGRTYRTVKIGTQTWMAQNLNYADSAAMTNLAGNSWCYRDSVANCAKYGRLYTWTAAMDANPYYKNTNLNDTILCQGVCPKGWHIPNNGEWKILETSVGGSDTAGVKLKSSSGWNDYNGVSGNGTDDYGFSALPAGYRSASDFFDHAGDDLYSGAYFWSATESSLDHIYNKAFSAQVSNTSTSMRWLIYNKRYAFSVRCVED